MTRYGHGRDGMRPRWVRSIVLSDVSNGCKYLLLVLAARMSERGVIAGPVARTLAKELGVGWQWIAAHISEAKKAGLLEALGSPARGRPVDYHAVLAPGVRSWSDALPIGTASPAMRRAAADQISAEQVGIACKILLMFFVHMMDAFSEVRGPRRDDLAEILGVARPPSPRGSARRPAPSSYCSPTEAPAAVEPATASWREKVSTSSTRSPQPVLVSSTQNQYPRNRLLAADKVCRLVAN